MANFGKHKEVKQMGFKNMETIQIMQFETLRVIKQDDDAKIPTRSYNDAVGYDLYSLEGGVISAGSKQVIRTGISLCFPQLVPFRVYGSIRSRSGLSVHHNLEVGAGVIDPDYKGEICVVLRNHGKEDYVFTKHTKIAQIVLEVYYVCNISVHTDESKTNKFQLTTIERGEKKFGSTDSFSSQAFNK